MKKVIRVLVSALVLGLVGVSLAHPGGGAGGGMKGVHGPRG